MKLETRPAATASVAREESLARAIVQLNPKSARAKRVVAAVTIGIPATGFAIAMYLMFTGRLSALDYTLFAVFYAIQMFGVSIGFHRYLAHKSFKTSPFFEGVLMITGSMALEGPVLFWVSTHRRHHRFSDEQGDPHSPNLRGTGLKGKLKGLWYAHVPWMFSDQESRVTVFAPDVVRDRRLYFYNRTYPDLGVGKPAPAGSSRLRDRRHPRGGVLRFHLWRIGAGIHRQSGSLVRWIHQSHDRFAAVRDQR